MDHLTVTGSQFPRLAKRDSRNRTEAHLPHAPVKLEAKYP